MNEESQTWLFSIQDISCFFSNFSFGSFFSSLLCGSFCSRQHTHNRFFNYINYQDFVLWLCIMIGSGNDVDLLGSDDDNDDDGDPPGGGDVDGEILLTTVM